ncbi:MAG: hypothetical protein ABII20_02875 [Candidatus Omnitrophota bacterium]|nr:hypothetical protein [Candidatus Omnitrophota bacterium]MBU3930588.1 hypothetical protein [bacterium]MBU4123052.1 hypothetical protein [bacterium]
MIKKFFAGMIFLAPSFLFSAGELAIVWDAGEQSNTLSWTLPQVTLPVGSYKWHEVDVYRTFGSSVGVDGWTLLASGVIDGTLTDYVGYGTYSYELRNVVQWNYDSVADAWSSSAAFPTYGPVRSYFISDGSNNNVVEITDAAGGSDGIGAQWKFTYSLQETCYPDIRIYKPGTKFTKDSEGFYERPASTWCVKEIINYDGVYSAPRPQGTNYEEWDCTNSSGVLVANGIYYVMFEIFDPFEPPDAADVGISARYYDFGGNGLYRKRGAYVGVIPVDILRVKDLTVTGITQSNTASSIGYHINASAAVTVLILDEGANFAIASATGTISYGSGSSYVYYAGSLIPASGLGADIVQVITYFRGYGANTETWDGTGPTGISVANGIYPVGVCARDGSGNTAISVSGNDQPFFEYITVDKRTSSSAVEGDAPLLGSVSPSSGTTVGSCSVITVALSDASGVNAAATTISVTSGTVVYSHANANATQSPIAGSATSTSFTLTLSTAITGEGSYTITVIAADIYGNQQTFTSKFTISAAASAGDNFKAVVKAYPQPATGGYIDIDYDTSPPTIFGVGTSVITLEVYTIFGEMVKRVTATTASPYRWNYLSLGLAPGVYIYRIKAVGNGKTYEAVKKAVIYK